MRKIILFCILLVTGCSSGRNGDGINSDRSSKSQLVYSTDLSEQIEDVIPSVVEVVAILDYDVEHYQYERTEIGAYIKDPESKTGYKLQAKGGIKKDSQNIKSFGTGLIIGQSDSRFLILTSHHIVFNPDTISNYITEGRIQTDVVRTRAFLAQKQVAVRSQQFSILREAVIEASDPATDLALISVRSDSRLGQVFRGDLAEYSDKIWGKLGVIAGYPLEVLQISMGLTSGAPYPGNFSLDVSGTFGFSGGPVFLFEPEKGLSFAGIGRCIPGKRVFYVSPDSTLQFSTNLLPTDIQNLQITEMPLLNATRMYAIDLRFISRFIQKSQDQIRKKRFVITKGLQPILTMDN